jgi:hypothetical protein
MKMRVRSILLLAFLLTAGCASSRNETWIGSNVGAAVCSPAPQDAPPVSR